MEAHLSDFQRRAGVEAHLSATADETRLSADARTALFRILQEALTNIARHAEATAVTVRLEENGKTVNGQGADTDTLVASCKAYVHALNKLLTKRQKTAPAALSA